MYQQQYYVPKFSSTLTEMLLAFGAADVLADLVEQYMGIGKSNVTLQDVGSYYMIDTGTPIREEWIEAAQPFETVAYLTSSKVQLPEELAGTIVRDVDETWETFNTYRERRKQLGEQKLSGDEIEQALADLKPQPDWNVVTYLGDYRMQAQNIHNSLVEQWRRSSDTLLALNLRTLLALFASPSADWSAIAADWKKAAKGTDFRDSVTASQLFNPHMGKGQNRAKADKLTMGNEKSFWLLEYLKAAGLWVAAAPTRATNADLRKTYILAPSQLELRYHRDIFAKFRDRLWNEGAVKQDIVAALLYTEVLLEQSIENDNLDVFAGGGVTNLVHGMHVVTYQLLSANSYTTMNLSFLGLPDWMPAIRTSDDAGIYVSILREHQERIRAIDEDRSEGYALLQLYRDFVSGNYLAPFFEFLADYSSYLMSALDRSQFYIKPFSETNLRRLLSMVDDKLSPILENEGFRNIAYAIRMSTVVPLYLGRSQSRFDVRYGLGQELARKSQYKDDFVQALAEFMQSYNDETMRVHERTKGRARRKLITTQDITDIVTLIDAYDSKTICNLLVAFGYARDPREKVEEEAGVLGELPPEEEAVES